jgi:uncharacterized membrane-anchored protein YhcB (DUF1043 family)
VENIWLISVAALVVGALIGYLMGRSGGGNNQAEIAAQLEDTQQELENYKTEVNEHFEKTAALVNNLTNSYKEVHEHLARGAQGLCQPGSVDLSLEPAMQEKLTDESETTEAPSKEEDNAVPTPPLDYAPKTPDQEGMLSETFGLKEKEAEEDITTPTPDVAAQKEEKTPA